MLRIGIVGKENSELYKTALQNNSNQFKLIGLFDPSFQFEIPDSLKEDCVFASFDELICKCDCIIFSSTEKIYLPLIEHAIKYSNSIFLHGAHNFSIHELNDLQKLSDEAQGIIQIQHSFLFNDAYIDYRDLKINPLLMECNLLGISDVNLLPSVRNHALAVLCQIKSTVRKITANTISSFGELPDIVKVRIDFANSCVAEIVVNSVEASNSHTIKSYNYNSYNHIDFIKNEFIIKQKDCIKKTLKYKPQSEIDSISKQLEIFFFNVLNHQTPICSIDNQLHTQIVVNKVKEKIRLCVNL